MKVTCARTSSNRAAVCACIRKFNGVAPTGASSSSFLYILGLPEALEQALKGLLSLQRDVTLNVMCNREYSCMCSFLKRLKGFSAYGYRMWQIVLWLTNYK